LPFVSVLVLHVASPLLRVTAVHNAAVPFLNVTVPVGVLLPLVAATVAVNVTLCPTVDGSSDDVTLVVVATTVTLFTT
jgi:hypothetical protein